MSIGARVALGVVLAALLAYMATPVAIVAARRFSLLDVPAWGTRKGHAAPTPYLGGAAVMLAFALATVVGAGRLHDTLPLLGGIVVLWLTGTLDDHHSLSPRLRLLVEFVVGALLSASGLGWKLGAGGMLDAAVTGLWVVGVINAFNLFDNMDGAASTMGLAVGAGLCGLSIIEGNPWGAAGSAALCGACLGFLPHNLARPARIFLGDGGSMPLGFTVAVLTASAAGPAEPSILPLFMGLALVGVPAFDTCLVIVSRRRRGISILTGGQDHLTHRTRRRLRTPLRVAVLLGATQAVVSGSVILATRDDSAAVVYVVLALVICACAAMVGLDADAAVRATPHDAAQAPSRRVRVGATGHGDAGPADRLTDVGTRTLLAVLGLGAGLSPLFSAFYSTTTWVPIGLAIVILTAAAAMALPNRLTLAGGLAVAGLAGLGLESLLSTSWAHAVEQATLSGNLWLVYASVLLLLVVMTRTRSHAQLLLAVVGVGIGAVAASVLVRMLGADASSLFLHGRLNSPLGYINGEGCVFAMGCWLSLALAERRHAIAAGAGTAAAIALACLTFLSESRGALLATGAAVLVALIVIPGRSRRTVALAVIGAGVAAASHWTLGVYSAGQHGSVPTADARHAALAIAACAAAGGVLWGALVWSASRLERGSAHRGRRLRQAGAVVAVVIVALPLLAAATHGASVESTARSQWHAFVNLTPQARASGSADETRLLSGAGNRYDYWRVAWRVFTEHPVAGVGAGNYTADYFLMRRTQEVIQNPHSIEMQTLSELGVVGALLLSLFAGAVVLGVSRARQVALRSRADRALMVGATGMFVVWLVDTSVDWMHLLPGVTAIALAAVAVLCRPLTRPSDSGAAARAAKVPWLIAGATAVVVLVFSGATLLRTEVVQRYVADAHAALPDHPAVAISDTRKALSLDAADLDAYYIGAAGLARFDRASAARAELLAAAREDPDEFVTWVLLGDLEVRLRQTSAARLYYGRAAALDPNDPSLPRLAHVPARQTSRPRPHR